MKAIKLLALSIITQSLLPGYRRLRENFTMIHHILHLFTYPITSFPDNNCHLLVVRYAVCKIYHSMISFSPQNDLKT